MEEFFRTPPTNCHTAPRLAAPKMPSGRQHGVGGGTGGDGALTPAAQDFCWISLAREIEKNKALQAKIDKMECEKYHVHVTVNVNCDRDRDSDRYRTPPQSPSPEPDRARAFNPTILKVFVSTLRIENKDTYFDSVDDTLEAQVTKIKYDRRIPMTMLTDFVTQNGVPRVSGRTKKDKILSIYDFLCRAVSGSSASI